MAITPASYSFRVQRRADHPLTVTFKDSTGVAIDLTGWQIIAQVWDKPRTVKIGDFTVTVANSASGQVELMLPYSITTIMIAPEYYYDVMLIDNNGLREYYMEGIIRPSEGYSTL